jgi:hypothetical protein
VVTPVGQAATAFVDGRHVVIESFSVSGPGGTFTKTFGVKAGLPTETFTCSLSDGGTFTVVYAPVAPRL